MYDDAFRVFPEASSVSVFNPHIKVASYFFFDLRRYGIALVASPKAIGINPVASGSNVPACPIFVGFNFFFYNPNDVG